MCAVVRRFWHSFVEMGSSTNELSLQFCDLGDFILHVRLRRLERKVRTKPQSMGKRVTFSRAILCIMYLCMIDVHIKKRNPFPQLQDDEWIALINN